MHRSTRLAAWAAAAGAMLAAAGFAVAPAQAAPTTETLARATATLRGSLTTPGTAWAYDPGSARVVVSVDSTVTGDALTRVRKLVGGLDGAVALRSVKGRFSTRIRGGDAIFGSSYECSLGFNVRRGDLFYFLTAGHCTNLATNWFTSPAHTTLIGIRVGTSFPGNDYGIVRYKNAKIPHPGMVNRYDGTYADMASAATPAVGQVVRRSGARTGLHSGHVTGLDATVNYDEGQVSGLIMTDVCAESGDSGGALYYGTTAYGLTSGGNGDCTSGGITFFQPVTEVLKRYNVTIY